MSLEILRTGEVISIHALREEGDFFLTRGTTATTRTFLSTPSARRATGGTLVRKPLLAISIHALREEGDSHRSHRAADRRYFYPRPPRGGRLWKPGSVPCQRTFLSTPSARRATKARLSTQETTIISIHALREEGDAGVDRQRAGDHHFYPRPPRGGRPRRRSPRP